MIGTERLNLAPAPEEAVQAPEHTPAESVKRVETEWSRFLEHHPSVGLTAKDDNEASVPPYTWSVRRALSISATSKLISACKEINVSVTTAIQVCSDCGNGFKDRTALYLPTFSTYTEPHETFLQRARHLMEWYAQEKDPLWVREEV
ncbi:MAG: hypothetical protein Q9162_005224 [Coniocarpon cinnabarinum]